MSEKYLTAPLPSAKLPGGIPFIIGNEAAERFSFYGMKAILVIFMTKHLLARDGTADFMTEEQAKTYYHMFVSWAYFLPLLGALISDGLFGKYRTIIGLSLVYCLGHLALALDDTRMGLALGLTLIAIGAGGVKPCVSAHVGDQFGALNHHLLSRVFAWFYFAINLGAFVSMLLTPVLLKKCGPSVAFAVPGVLMLVATVVFWAGRHKFVHVPAGGVGFVRELFSPAGLRAAWNQVYLYVFVALFWSLFDQTGSSWVLQAEKMDRRWLGVDWLSAQIQAVNSLLILLFIPLFSYVIYPAINRVFPLTPLRKIAIGFFLAAAAFAIVTHVESLIVGGARPNIVWHIAAYTVLTAAEVLVSITCLEFSYTQAPKSMKSFVMSLYLVSVAAGNLLTSGVNYLIQDEGGTSRLTGVQYFYFFTLLMLSGAIAFTIVARFYRGRTYIQDEHPAA
jgi:POT family proton-dependent oligopeptide transporter